MIKNAQQRGFTAGLLPYGCHADTRPEERTFLISGDPDKDKSRRGDLENVATKSIGTRQASKAYSFGNG